jgi:predicted component of viral defense system (DUF524 family)
MNKQEQEAINKMSEKELKERLEKAGKDLHSLSEKLISVCIENDSALAVSALCAGLQALLPESTNLVYLNSLREQIDQLGRTSLRFYSVFGIKYRDDSL